MKNIFLPLALICGMISTSFSQEFSYGLKGGVNYTMGGQITGNSSNGIYWDGTVEGQGQVGYHGGAFVQVNFGNFFVRPEVVYTSLESEFDFPNQPSTYSVEKFDIPFLVGYNVFGPIDIYAGPVYSNILNSSLMGNELESPIVVQNSPINAQAGIKVEFGRFGLDVRYERTLSAAERQDLDIDNDQYGVNLADFDDARLNQIIVSVIFKLGGPGLNVRRGRPCY